MYTNRASMIGTEIIDLINIESLNNHFRFNLARSKSSRPCGKLSKTSTAFQSPTRPMSPSSAKKSQFSSKRVKKECTILVKCSTNQHTDNYALTKCKYEHYLLAVQKPASINYCSRSSELVFACSKACSHLSPWLISPVLCTTDCDR